MMTQRCWVSSLQSLPVLATPVVHVSIWYNFFWELKIDRKQHSPRTLHSKEVCSSKPKSLPALKMFVSLHKLQLWLKPTLWLPSLQIEVSATEDKYASGRAFDIQVWAVQCLWPKLWATNHRLELYHWQGVWVVQHTQRIGSQRATCAIYSGGHLQGKGCGNTEEAGICWVGHLLLACAAQANISRTHSHNNYLQCNCRVIWVAGYMRFFWAEQMA